MNLAGIDTNLVVALAALLRERNVTRAARVLGLGQSSTSHALARLRAHFGDPLLVRVGHEMVLTERALALAAPAAAAVESLQRVFQAPTPFEPKEARRTFRIASTDNLELYLLPRLAPLLSREAPHVDLHFTHLRKDWMPALARGDFDLKLGRRYALAPGLQDEPLFRDRLVCIVRKGHPLRARLTLPRYAKLSHIRVLPAEADGGPMDAVLERAHLSRRIAISVQHFLVALFVVASSDLALTAPARLVTATRGALHLRAVPLPLPAAEYTLSQVWAQRHDADPAHRWLRDLVRRAIV
jgi:DNA-binding transcriptional LysR family regulator